MEKRRNLKEILRKGIKPEDLVAVRAIYNSNKGDNKLYASPFRPTIHFSLNHMIKINKRYGDWDDANAVILIPFKQLINDNKENFFGGTAIDVFCIGYATLSCYEVVKRNKENSKEFRRKVEDKIREMGYAVLPRGNWAWNDSGKAIKQFEDLLRKLGDYSSAPHCDTLFSSVEKKVVSIFSSDGKINVVKSKRLIKRYIEEMCDFFNLECIKRDKKDLSLDEFYDYTRDKKVECESYGKWFNRRMKEKETLKFPKSGLGFNSSFYRTVWCDVFFDSLEETIKQNLELSLKWKKEAEKYENPRNIYEEIEHYEFIEKSELHAKIAEESLRYKKFRDYINSWLMYWNKKE